jgi:hypothetical protein
VSVLTRGRADINLAGINLYERAVAPPSNALC